ncbi:amylo-alpha-1,6-glucosidase [Thermodesulfobacteriota bacterium]
MTLIQDPHPGAHLLLFRGDTQTFTISASHAIKGLAWLRTTIGHAGITRKEIINGVLLNSPALGRDWFDIPMKQVDEGRFEVTLPLLEVGHFEAKCFFLKSREDMPLWPEGTNTVINVEPADTCCANIVYNAFVRQFGPNKSGGGTPDSSQIKSIQALDNAGYTVIPKSGTFRDLISELDFIIGELGCRIIQLLPIHPTPTTYGRMGRFGSPFAALSFTAVDPALAEFDARATPLEQFIELVDAVHQRNAKILIDIAINHTGWAAAIHETHPEWLVRDPEGKIEVPGAWGVRWEDLTKLDYHRKDLWQYMADVFLTWCRRGVDGFRCDAGYMIPVAAWKYIVAQVRKQFPDTLFLLEGLGGKISVTRDILNLANFNWAYSELFQNYNRSQIENYLPEANTISQGDGITVHFAETHDNPRLAARSNTYAKMRTALCALCSHQGAFGFANGVEWFATEKINVHETPSLNWGATENQIEHLRRINAILKSHPAFHDQTVLKMLQAGKGTCLVLLRHHLPTGKKILVVANLDDAHPTIARWKPLDVGISNPQFVDLLNGKTLTPKSAADQCELDLEPGAVLCLSSDAEDLEIVHRENERVFLLPERIEHQRLRAKALEAFVYYHGVQDLDRFDPEKSARMLIRDPLDYCRRLNPVSEESRVITWCWPRDLQREIMVPPGHFLLVRVDIPFRARILNDAHVFGFEESLLQSDGNFFALFMPPDVPSRHISLTLKLDVFEPGSCRHVDAPLLLLTRAENARVKSIFQRAELQDHPLITLGTNGHGGMLRAHAAWGDLTSRYDALLAANLHPEIPEDRRVMFSRCRAWLVFQDYSQELNCHCQESFHFDYRRGYWRFQVPTGQGAAVVLTVSTEMISGENRAQLVFHRHPKTADNGRLDDASAVRLILRPDIEDRSFHETTKAYLGLEDAWPESIVIDDNGFSFAPNPNRRLQIHISRGNFVPEPEWQYMIHRPIEKERGLDPDSDLFSPGFFSVELNGGEHAVLTCQISTSKHQTRKASPSSTPLRDLTGLGGREKWEPADALEQALDHYIVKRGKLKSVVAGYPWFLDWGRDAIIVVRGMIAAQRTREARDVLKQFGQFEIDGTLPNMIRGQDTGNRDTSDAPLWFFVACGDLIDREGSKVFLDEMCGGRTIRQILISIGYSLKKGTRSGIRMDPESGLLFSPSHFTWMDTNHPAGTPREGYPVEIQALWYCAVSFLSQIDPDKPETWQSLSDKIQSSIVELFWLEREGYLSDCLHAGTGISALKAEPDNALRPNQLLAITLGALKDTSLCRKIVTACQELLVPGAIRSLADRPVQRALSIVHHGKKLNDPHQPYQGRYQGDEDTQRKPAYHNGTAWTWLFPSFCEAWINAYGDQGRAAAASWLASGIRLMNSGCVGHIPEILDGDAPHTPRGCDAQAWGVSELLRVWLLLEPNIPI